MRTGYTTGANATAAAAAATRALFTQQPQNEVTIRLPLGQDVTFTLHSCELTPEWARCSTIKDGGDDPDATHGAEIVATVRWGDRPGLVIDRGVGVGLVTRPGLGLEVGTPAINPVPRQMMAEHVIAIAGADLIRERGLHVEISVPKGEEIARKTMNARLGILGGISILGTTGIVVPYSTAAYRASVVQGMDVALGQGCDHLVLTTGGRSEKYAMQILSHLPEVAFIQMGEFMGFSLRAAADRPQIKRISMFGMIGKFSKAAQGKFHLHVAASQVDTGFLAGMVAECGGPPDLVQAVKQANTARHVQEMCLERGMTEVFTRLCEYVAVASREYARAAYRIEVCMTDFAGQVLGRAEVAPRDYTPDEAAARRPAVVEGDADND